jgi:PAS domain S-box-containing protein
MQQPLTTTLETVIPEFLSGGGEMGTLIRSKDWSKTPLGSPDTWPQSLRTTVSLCIASNFPISISWGPHRVQIYNDGYWPITGDMHPISMGQDFKECWLSAWPVIGQAFEEASLGKTRYLENQRIFLDRYGYKEETFFTFSFSPILDESGGVGGLFHPVIEQTQQTLAERRLNILHTIPDQTVNAKTAGEASALVAECLQDFCLDIPFVLLYSITDDGKEANLQSGVGVEAGSPLAQSKIDLHEQHPDNWPFAKVIQNVKAIQVDELEKIFKKFNCGPYPEAPHQALIFPITLPGTTHINYLLVTGVSARRGLDEKYRLFYELLAEAIKNALAKARAYEEERKKSEALAEIDKAKTVFFSNISHEFRTPLTLMLGSLEELLNNRNGEIKATDKEAIETSHRNAMRLLRLVNNLLDFSRLEAGRVQAQYQLTDIAKYTTELASNFRSVVEAAGLKFQIRTDAVIQPVFIDKEMWEKIVLNLLSNAFKYTLKGSITLSLTSENNQVLLKVADTGVGIPENEFPKMFQRFHRVQNVVGRTYEGTGIGLSLVSELVKLHGGEIRVQSKEGEGSLFTVSIPTGKSHLPTQHVIENGPDFTASLSNAFIEEATTLIEHSFVTSNGKESLKGNADTVTVLVVDDNADMRAYIKNLLRSQYHVVTATNGMDALQKIKEHLPKLIVSDIMMPVMDGIGLLKAVKENVQTQNIPVILLSARAGEESKIEGYQTGADDYLIKPFSSKELLARVASQLKLVALRQAAETNVRNLFMQAPAFICVLRGPKHTYHLVNALYLQLIGNRDVVGKSVREALPELKGSGIFELLDEVYKTGEPFIASEMPVLLQRTSGELEEGILNFIYQPSRNAQGEIDGILVHGVEVTEQIIARKKIEESEEKFRTVTQSLPQLIWSTDKDGMVDFFNQQWFDYTGSTPERSFGPEWSQYIHAHDVEGLLQKWNHSLQTGEPVLSELRIRGKDESYKWFNVSANPVRNSKGEIVKWLGALTDIGERRKWEENLRQSEGRFRALVTATSDVVYRMSPDWIEMRALEGRGFLSDTGEPIKDWMHKYIYPKGQQRVRETINEAVKNKTIFELEHQVVKADGSLGWTFSRAIPIIGSNGEIIEWFGAASDVTDRNNIAEALKKSEQHLELLSNTVPAMIFYLDSEQRYQSCNEAFCLWFGVSSKEAIGKTVRYFIGEEAYTKVFPHLAKAYAGEQERYEMPMPSRAGAGKWLSIVYTPHKNDAGKVLGIIVHATDITQSKQVEITLRESESRFRHLADESPMFVFIMEPDASATVNYWNKTWLAYTGQSLQEAIGKAWDGVIHPDDVPVVLAVYVPAFQNRQPYVIPAVRTRRHDGAYRWHTYKGNPRFATNGEFNGYVGVGFDVHEQKITEEKLEALVNERTKELLRSNEDLQQFAHVASHDLKEPVRKIMTFSSLIRSELGLDLSEKLNLYLSKVDAAAIRMYSMIDGVLLYSSLNALEQTKESIDLKELCQGIESDLEVLIAQKEATFKFNKTHTIKGSSILLYQLFYNLINNSLKFSNPERKLEIMISSAPATPDEVNRHQLATGKEFIKIILQDNGIGFSNADADKVFGTFTRLHSKDKYEGTGLGLSLCKKIAERHGGTISASGKEGIGARFQIILPEGLEKE